MRYLPCATTLLALYFAVPLLLPVEPAVAQPPPPGYAPGGPPPGYPPERLPPPGYAPGRPPPPGYAPIPPPRAEVVPPAPGPRMIWEPGHWHWNGFQYVWVSGRYVPVRPHYREYAPGRWVWRGGGWVWIPAHWR